MILLIVSFFLAWAVPQFSSRSGLFFASAVLLTVPSDDATASTATLPQRTLALPLGDLRLPVTVGGNVRYRLRGDRADIEGQVDADLQEVQRQATAVLAALLDHRQQCGDRVSVRDGRVGARQAALTVVATIDYGRSVCVAGQEMSVLPRALYEVEMLLHPVARPRSLRLRAEVTSLRKRGGQLSAALDRPLRQMLGSLIDHRIGELFPTGAVPKEVTLRTFAFNESKPNQLIAQLNAVGSVPLTTLDRLIQGR